MKKLLVFLLAIFAQTGFSQDEIYNVKAPEVMSVWHRVADYSPQLRSVEAAELSPDGRLAVSASKFGYQLMMWRVADGFLMWENKHESEIECVTFSPDGKWIASGGEDYAVRIWEAESGNLIRTLMHDSSIDGITWSHDGKWLVAGSEKGDAWFWKSAGFELGHKINFGSTINSLDFTQDDEQLLVAGNIQTKDPTTGKTLYHGFVKRLAVSSQQIVKEYIGHEASVKSVRISPNNKYVASGSFDHTARLYDFESGKLLHTFKEPLRVEAVTFTQDSRFLLTGGHQKKISFYRLSDYQLAVTIPSPRTEYLHFSQDGRLLLSSHEDSGLLSLYIMLSDTQHRNEVYQRISNQQLNNKDLKN